MTDPVILVPLDGSKRALGALPVARRFAELLKARVRILHVTDRAASPHEAAASLGLAPADLEGATLEVRPGAPAEAILAAAADGAAQLIVIGAYAADARPDGGLGADALAVLMGALCPVVLVDPAAPPPGDWTLKRMLAAHDGSPGVSDALRSAAELAREAGAELVVLQVADGPRDLEAGSIAPPRYIDQIQHGWPAWTDEFLQRLACVCPLADVRLRLLARHGEPAEETIRVAAEERADLIALAWKGHWEGTCAPTLKAVLRAAPCPVMVPRVPAA